MDISGLKDQGVERNAHILKELDRLLQDSEIELVDVETAGTSRGLVVRIFVDKPGGVSVEDCARLSRAVGDLFEAEGTVSGRYVLEVSSPGIDRPLRRPKDFERFTGETARVSTYEKIGGAHQHQGVLSGYDSEADAVVLRDETGVSLTIPLGAIRKANLKRDPWAGKSGQGRSESRSRKRK